MKKFSIYDRIKTNCDKLNDKFIINIKSKFNDTYSDLIEKEKEIELLIGEWKSNQIRYCYYGFFNQLQPEFKNNNFIITFQLFTSPYFDQQIILLGCIYYNFVNFKTSKNQTFIYGHGNSLINDSNNDKTLSFITYLDAIDEYFELIIHFTEQYTPSLLDFKIDEQKTNTTLSFNKLIIPNNDKVQTNLLDNFLEEMGLLENKSKEQEVKISPLCSTFDQLPKCNNLQLTFNHEKKIGNLAIEIKLSNEQYLQFENEFYFRIDFVFVPYFLWDAVDDPKDILNPLNRIYKKLYSINHDIKINSSDDLDKKYEIQFPLNVFIFPIMIFVSIFNKSSTVLDYSSVNISYPSSNQFGTLNSSIPIFSFLTNMPSVSLTHYQITNIESLIKLEQKSNILFPYECRIKIDDYENNNKFEYKVDENIEYVFIKLPYSLFSSHYKEKQIEIDYKIYYKTSKGGKNYNLICIPLDQNVGGKCFKIIENASLLQSYNINFTTFRRLSCPDCEINDIDSCKNCLRMRFIDCYICKKKNIDVKTNDFQFFLIEIENPATNDISIKTMHKSCFKTFYDNIHDKNDRFILTIKNNIDEKNKVFYLCTKKLIKKN